MGFIFCSSKQTIEIYCALKMNLLNAVLAIDANKYYGIEWE
jgi:hypothetical protein